MRRNICRRWFPGSRGLLIICLAPLAGKMNRISRCDWLPERASWSYLARSGYGLCPASTQIMLWCFIPFYKSFLDQASSVKMAGYWPSSFFCVFMDRVEEELGQYPAILTEQAWSITHTSFPRKVLLLFRSAALSTPVSF